jgi:hypothetical protein
MKGKRQLIEEIKTLNKQKLKAPTTYHKMSPQFDYFHGLCSMFFSQFSWASQAISSNCSTGTNMHSKQENELTPISAASSCTQSTPATKFGARNACNSPSATALMTPSLISNPSSSKSALGLLNSGCHLLSPNPHPRPSRKKIKVQLQSKNAKAKPRTTVTTERRIKKRRLTSESSTKTQWTHSN